MSTEDLEQLPTIVSKNTQVLKCSPPFESLVLPCINGTLGIPKTQLKLAALQALYTFHSILSQTEILKSKDNITASSKDSEKDARLESIVALNLLADALKSSLVILATLTEHLPAINLRKSIIIYYHNTNVSNFVKLAEFELRWTSILFSSPLPKHNKSPILWNHRQWVIQLLYPTNKPISNPFFHSNCEKELPVIFAAADRHRNNYYCYSYARWLCKSYLFQPGASNLGPRFFQIESDLYSQIVQFAKSHVSDISAWTFLLHFLLGVPASLDFLTGQVQLKQSLKNGILRSDDCVKIRNFDKERLPQSIDEFLQSVTFEFRGKTNEGNVIEATHFGLLVYTIDSIQDFAAVVPGHDSVSYFLNTSKSIVDLYKKNRNSSST